MILNDLDLGSGHPFLGPDAGVTVANIVVEGSYTVPYGRAGKLTAHSVKLYAKAWQGIGGQTALTIAASRYVLRQAQELAANRRLGPVYIRWTSTSDPAAINNTSDLADGWYWITSFRPDYSKLPSGLVPVQMQVVEAAEGGSEHRVAMRYDPSSPGLATTYLGSSMLAIGYPLNAVGLAGTSVTRTGAEGAIPLTVSPAAVLNPIPFALSATTGDWFKGDVKVYDTVNTGANPVPTTGGTFVNANWVRVYDRSHRFEGDCVITNGLLLLHFPRGSFPVANCYLWSTGLSTANWQLFGQIEVNDNSGNTGTLRAIALERVSPESTLIRTTMSTAGGVEIQVDVRLERGMYLARCDLRPLSETPSVNNYLAFLPNNILKTIYNGSAVTDAAVGTADLLPDGNYGYAAAFTANSTVPYLCGLLWQAKPVWQPKVVSSSQLGVGDSGNPTAPGIASYAVFAIPYGVNASYSPANLQGEAEAGTFVASMVSAADATASGSNAGKLPSGSTVGNVTFGTSFTPPAGTYAIWHRLRVTTAGAGTGNGIQIGVKVAGTPANMVSFPQVSLTATYVWYAAPNLTVNGSQAVQFYAAYQGSGAVPTDFWVDQAVLVPLTLSGGKNGPQELWQQFMADRSTQLIRL